MPRFSISRRLHGKDDLLGLREVVTTPNKEREKTMKKEVKKAKKSSATGKKTAPSKTAPTSNPMWVWALDYEDINELERDFSVWHSQASAKAHMEKEIRDLSDIFHGKIEREDDLHAVLEERFYWSIRKIKVHDDQDIDM